MSDIYCGIKKVPKGKRLGTMQECTDLKKVNYWGLYKIDPSIIQYAIDGKKSESQINMEMKKRISEIKIKIQSLHGKVSNIKNQIKKESDKSKRAELRKTKKLYVTEGIELTEEMEKLEKKVKK